MARPVLLLDLGGVLADLGDPVTAMSLDMSTETFWRIWLGSPTVRAFETGGLDAGDFLATVSAELGCAGDDSFAQRFDRWQLRLFPGIEQLVALGARDHQVALLSNTNEIHWSQVTSATQVFSTFAHVFLSYETGCYKPATAAYREVIEHFDVAPGDIAFFDDSRANVDTARELGIDAHLVSGPKEVMHYLGRK